MSSHLALGPTAGRETGATSIQARQLSFPQLLGGRAGCGWKFPGRRSILLEIELGPQSSPTVQRDWKECYEDPTK